MDEKLVNFSFYNKQNYPFCTLNLQLEKFWHCLFSWIIKVLSNYPKFLSHRKRKILFKLGIIYSQKCTLSIYLYVSFCISSYLSIYLSIHLPLIRVGPDILFGRVSGLIPSHFNRISDIETIRIPNIRLISNAGYRISGWFLMPDTGYLADF